MSEIVELEIEAPVQPKIAEVSNSAESLWEKGIKVAGEIFTHLPEDLYIPPDALEVILETFEGPLDLLLYLIKRQNLDILDIPIAKITEQYMQYVELMKDIRLELAAEYLVMAAVLAEIKSRMLLPRPAALTEDEESDPRAELIRRLQEYERFKNMAEKLDQLPRFERDVFAVEINPPDMKITQPLPVVKLDELIAAFSDVLKRMDMRASHTVTREPLSIRERMTQVLEKLKQNSYTTFYQLFSLKEGRMGVVVTFIAILELVKGSMIELVQAESYSEIHVKAV